ncbi:MAG: substrate-binding domain-containing protein [Anaerolineae bacterium]|nr:substrate-binding domain-containing protein [Anaerolineae bacterium]
MPYSWRLFRPVLLVAVAATMIFTLAVPVSLAQDEEAQPVVVQGTPELETLANAIADAYMAASEGAEVPTDTSGGLRAAFEGLCSGDVDVVLSTGPISDAQIQACADQGQGFVEVVLAYEALALLATPEAGLTCLAQTAVSDAWQSGAADLTWADLGSQTFSEAVTFYGPEAGSRAARLFESLVPAGALRDGIESPDDPAALLAKVQEAGAGAFAYMMLADLAAADPDGAVVPLQVRDAAGTCIAPQAETLADRTYPLARTDYLYINAESAARPEVQAFVEFALMGEGGVMTQGPALGYTPADEVTYETGFANLLDAKTGRTFSRPISPIRVDATTGGTLTVTGTAMLYDLVRRIEGQFTSQYDAATLEADFAGNAAGWDAFCAGEADVLRATRAATEEQLAQCAANGVEPYTLDLGQQALVIAVPASADWIGCVNAEMMTALLRAGTEDAPAAMTWQEVDAAWPDRPLLLVAPPARTGETDTLVASLIGSPSFALRQDMTESSDPLYRAQGVANTDNGLTWLWWTDLQGSAAEVKQLSVDAGAGCVAPSAETFADGSYALSFPVQIHVSQAAFANPLVRAYLWHFFAQSTLDTLANYPFAGFDLDAYSRDVREDVYEMLAAYEAQAAEAPVEEVAPTETPAEETATETPADAPGSQDATATPGN